jgi:hypothetical protein
MHPKIGAAGYLSYWPCGLALWAGPVFCLLIGVSVELLCYLPSKERECVGLAIVIPARLISLTTT